MQRYQVYLNPKAVQILDDYEEETAIERSAMIRMAVNNLAQNIVSLIPSYSEVVGDLDSVVGLIKAKGKKKNKSSEKIDDIYYDR